MMKQLLCYVLVLFCVMLLVGGCVPDEWDHHTYRIPTQHGPGDRPGHDRPGPDHPGPGHPGGGGHGGGHGGGGTGGHGGGGTGDHGDGGPDGPGGGGTGGPGGGGTGGHGGGGTGGHGGGGTGGHGNGGPGGGDDGQRAIMSYVDQHALPVRITNIEHLSDQTVPAVHGAATQTIARYKVSTESTANPAKKADRIVDYNLDTGDLKLE